VFLTLVGEVCRVGFQASQALASCPYSRFELLLFQKALLVAVDQAREPRAQLRDLAIELLLRERRLRLAVIEPPFVFVLELGWIAKKLANILPHGGVEIIDTHLTVVAPGLPTEAGPISTNAPIIRMLGCRSVGQPVLRAKAVERMPALRAHEQSLEQPPGAPSGLTVAFPILVQLLGGCLKKLFADQRRHGDRHAGRIGCVD
jgi:hypothetical protein